uniref:Pentatricopeptide repeat-containing protein At4g01990, mitochondrial n=1 Tax=Elaeis guineensis var. tenera TaxID=51953 RepID=A0A6I9R6D4_ELAGV|nr:pentatricopeptide repeat-containing protein At4g01990, mitochondrial [Elaeis guineensis]
MAKNPIRPLSLVIAVARRLSTASLAAGENPSSLSSALAGDKGGTKEWKPLYRRLSALGGAPEGSVTKTLNKWVREGRPARAVELMKYVKELRKYRRYNHALELMDWMVNTRGMNMSYTNHAIRLDLIAKVRGIESAEEYFFKLPEPAKNERTYGALLNCYCSEKMADKANALYEKMNEMNIASSTLVHNNLMSLYMKLGQPEKVPAQVQEMKEKNIAPDNLTCCILMNSYASLGDIDSVEGVIKEMEEEGEVTLNWSAYSTLAAIYSSAGLVTKAESALKQLEELVDSHDREPFHFLISLYAGTGNLVEVNRIWKSLKTTFPKPTNMSFLTMLQALNKLDDIDSLTQCYEEWESFYVTYDLKLTNLMLGAYLRKGMVKEAEALWARTSEKGAGFDRRTCELFLDCYLKNHNMELALKWLENAVSMVKQDEWKLSQEKVSTFLKCLEEAKDVEGAERFSKSLKVLNCLDTRAYESLLRTYSLARRRDPSLRQRINDDKIELSSHTKRLLKRVSR